MGNNKNYVGEEFIDKLYKNLYMSEVVQHTKDNKDKRLEAIKKYFDRLERIHGKADTKGKKKLLYGRYIDKYVIKEDNISEHYDFEIEDILNGQKRSLIMWLDYLSNPTAVYPTWAKYWAFQGMLKMGSYDEFKGIYLKRDEYTEASFVDCNPEIIAKCIDTIIRLVNKEEITDELEDKLNKTDSFSKIYTSFEKQYKKNVIENASDEGIWIKYNQGNEQDAVRLSDSIKGKNTHWCTSSEDTAIRQVCGPYDNADYGGDFYVYYTKDTRGEYTMPRIAIRLIDTDEIGEIRGIEEGQNLEEKMIGVLEEKLKEMKFLSRKDVKKALEKVEDLKELTIIGNKTEKKEPLTTNEIVDLYTKNYGFGWTEDPKVEKIKNKRNLLDDYNMSNSIEAKIAIFENNYSEFDEKSIKELDVIAKVMRKKGSEILLYADIESLKENPKIALDQVRRVGDALEYIDEEIQKAHPKIVDVAVKDNDCNIIYAYKKYQDEHPEIFVSLLGEVEPSLLEYVDKDIQKAHPEIVEAALKGSPCVLQFVDKDIQKAHPEIVDVAIEESPSAIKYACKEYKANHLDILMSLVENDGLFLKYVDKEIQEEYPKIVMAAIKENFYALIYVDKELLVKNLEIVKEAAKRDNLNEVLRYLDKKLLEEHPEIVMTAVKENCFVLRWVDKEIQKEHPEIIMEAAKQDGYVLMFIDKEVQKAYPNIVLEAIKQNPDALVHVDEEVLINNKEIIMEAAKNNKDALYDVNEELLEEHPEIVLWAKEAQKETKKTKQRKLKPKKEDE